MSGIRKGNAFYHYNQTSKHLLPNNRRINSGYTARLWSFILNCKKVLSEISKEILQNWAYGEVIHLLFLPITQKNTTGRFLFDTYEGFSKKDLERIDASKDTGFNNTSIELMKQVIDPAVTQCLFVKGFFRDTITYEHANRQYAIESLDCGLYAPTRAAFDFFMKECPKGLFPLHDYSSLHWDGSKKAIDEFCKSAGEHVILIPYKSRSTSVRKTRG